jgi:hypothetical protein
MIARTSPRSAFSRNTISAAACVDLVRVRLAALSMDRGAAGHALRRVCDYDVADVPDAATLSSIVLT